MGSGPNKPTYKGLQLRKGSAGGIGTLNLAPSEVRVGGVKTTLLSALVTLRSVNSVAEKALQYEFTLQGSMVMR